MATMGSRSEIIDEDEFEIVSDSSLKINDENVAILSDSESQEMEPATDGTDKVVNTLKPAIDPYRTFEFIHNEHAALKQDLLSQQELVKEQADILLAQKNKAVELEERVALLTAENDKKDELLKNMDEQLKTYKETSEKADEVSAQLLQAEEQVKYYKEMVNQFQDNGFVDFQPPLMAADANLAREMKEKDEKLETSKKELVEKENALIGAKEENDKLKIELQNLSDFVLALQAQVDSYQLDIRDMKSGYEERIKILNDELNEFLNNRKTNSSQENSVNTQTGDEPVTLSHGDVHRRVYECERCKLRLPNVEIYNKHVLRCPSILDNLF